MSFERHLVNVVQKKGDANYGTVCCVRFEREDAFGFVRCKLRGSTKPVFPTATGGRRYNELCTLNL